MSSEQTILETAIESLDTSYDRGDDCLSPIDIPSFAIKKGESVSDPVYDLLRKRLQAIAPDSRIFKMVTASKHKTNAKKIRHDPPMASLEKANGPKRFDEYNSWLDRIKKTLGYTDLDGKIVQSYKRDGVAVALYYEDGNLVGAGLRPSDDTNEGEDVTLNIQYVEGVPKKLPFPISCSIRGELECPTSVFQAIKKDWQNPRYQLSTEPANSRTHTIGSIRQANNPEITKERKIRFVGYSIENLYSKDPNFVAPKTRKEMAIWCNKVLKVQFVRTEIHDFKDLQKMEDLANSLDYKVDGIVLSVNNLEDYEQMGRHGGRADGNPCGAIAWKFKDESATTTFKKSVWQTGRTGSITPVAYFDMPLYLDETNVRQVTLHNIGFMARNGIVPGVEVEVIKSGKIIPKVISVTKDGKTVGTHETNDVVLTRGDMHDFLKHFPEILRCPACACQPNLRQGNEGNWDLICTNPACSAKSINGLLFYLTTLGVKGIGESQLTKLLDANKITSWADFYRLTEDDLVECGLSERQALLALAAIHMIVKPSAIKDNEDLREQIEDARKSKKKIPAHTVFASLGVPTAGKQTGTELIAHFGNFDVIRKATIEQFLEVSAIGDKTAPLIFEFFEDRKKEIDDLLKYVEPELPKVGKFTGLTFCLSDVDKRRWTQAIESLGGKCTSSVSAKVNYLVAGPNSGSKRDAAEKLQKEQKDRGENPIQILAVEDLEKMV